MITSPILSQDLAKQTHELVKRAQEVDEMYEVGGLVQAESLKEFIRKRKQRTQSVRVHRL